MVETPGDDQQKETEKDVRRAPVYHVSKNAVF